MRVDMTVVKADIHYPTDASLHWSSLPRGFERQLMATNVSRRRRKHLDVLVVLRLSRFAFNATAFRMQACVVEQEGVNALGDVAAIAPAEHVENLTRMSVCRSP
jgi:hypothetical protein